MPASIANISLTQDSSKLEPGGIQSSLAILAEQREQWQKRPLLRLVYQDCFARMQQAMARDLHGSIGLSVELGCGGGFFKEACRDVVATDVVRTEWAERTLDAQNMDLDSGSVRNIVMFDVLHHIPKPVACFEEAVRVLEPGGRMVMLEPYLSPFSYCIYKLFHHEPVSSRGDPLNGPSDLSDAPMDGNSSTPTRIFFRKSGLRAFRLRFPKLHVIQRTKLSLLVYGLSGGFSGPILLPATLGKIGLAAERICEPALGWLMALRCLVVLERKR